MGSLLSTLIQSQMDEQFVFSGFGKNTAHKYINLPYENTHDYNDYVNFLKSDLSIEDHLDRNRTNYNYPQTLDINWTKEFTNKQKYKCVISYVDDYQIKLSNYYYKASMTHFANKTPYNFKMEPTHKNFEKIDFIKTILWWIKIEENFLKMMPRIEMLSVTRNQDFDQLEQICSISDKKLLVEIINDYNKHQTHDSKFADEFGAIIEKLKKSNKIMGPNASLKSK